MIKNNAGYINLIITIILFSTFEVISKTISGQINPFQLNFLRFFLGGIVLFTLLLINKDFRIGRKDLLLVGGLGIINIGICMNLLQLSLWVIGAKASIVAVIFSSNPIFVFLFSAIIEKEPVSKEKILGSIIGILGIIVIAFQKLDVTSLNLLSPVLAFISSLFFGLYSVLGRKISVRTGSLKMNSYSFIIGSLVTLPFLFAFKIPVIRFDYADILKILYLGIFVSGLAYFTYFRGLSAVGAGKGSLVFFLKPVFASILALVFLKEMAGLNLLLGSVMVLAGIGIIVRDRPQKNASADIIPE